MDELIQIYENISQPEYLITADRKRFIRSDLIEDIIKFNKFKKGLVYWEQNFARITAHIPINREEIDTYLSQNSPETYTRIILTGNTSSNSAVEIFLQHLIRHAKELKISLNNKDKLNLDI